MKQLKFISNNKQWLVVDESNLTSYNQYTTDIEWVVNGIICSLNPIILSEITEEQASMIVEKLKVGGYENYEKFGYIYLPTAIGSLKSLLKSKGVDDTWINPVIFRIEE